MRRKVVLGLNVGLFLGAVVGAAATSHASDWQPLGLVVQLALLAVLSDAMALRVGDIVLSGAFIALVLAMAFLGPLPAVAIGVLLNVVDVVRGRVERLEGAVSNLATYAVYPLVGALLVRAVRDAGVSPDQLQFAVWLALIYVITLALNFAVVAWGQAEFRGHRYRTMVHTILRPVLPSEAAALTLTVVCSLVYARAGFWALAVLVLALLAFQFLTRALLISQERAEQLAARTTEMASLQVGVLTALVQTLSLRDKMTARHSAAVARYARAMAEAIGCSKQEQELVHTAGLLHDIGKFIFPDRILLADTKLSDEDWEIVKKHPAQGAKVVGRVSGYGPVAEIILAHHERIDGKGYPNGVAGDDIPLPSRMISIADTYDVMTARDSYRKPVSQQEAIAELRRVSGAQLDGDLVEVFVRILAERGISFQHTTDADFDHEVDFEARVAGFLPEAA